MLFLRVVLLFVIDVDESVDCDVDFDGLYGGVLFICVLLHLLSGWVSFCSEIYLECFEDEVSVIELFIVESWCIRKEFTFWGSFSETLS